MIQLNSKSEYLQLQQFNDVQLSENYIKQLQQAIGNIKELLNQQEQRLNENVQNKTSEEQAIIDSIDFDYLQEAQENQDVLYQEMEQNLQSA